jgi:hypothetical protein
MNKKKNTNHLGLIRDMAAVGVPVDISVVEVDVEIEQIGGVNDSMIFDLPDGRTGCVIDLNIIDQTSKSIRCRDVELQSAWTAWGFEWLSDPLESGGDPFNYRFPGKGAPEMPRDQVLNHVLLCHGILTPGCPMEGCLLGIGDPKPKALIAGAYVDFTLTITGHDHNRYAETISLWVDPLFGNQQRTTEKIYKSALGKNGRSKSTESPNLGCLGQAPDHESVPAKKFKEGS